MKLVIASHNAGKIAEISALLAPLSFDLVLQSDLGVGDIPETGLTFVENALIKARHAASESGLPALADDSGLVVQALNGAPGIYSARYAGAKVPHSEHLKKLLKEMEQVPEEKRHAKMVCTMVFLRHAKDPSPIIASGEWHGTILTEPRGEGGFGYDPVFYLRNLEKTAAEITKDEKNGMSHRAIALRQLLHDMAEHKHGSFID